MNNSKLAGKSYLFACQWQGALPRRVRGGLWREGMARYGVARCTLLRYVRRASGAIGIAHHPCGALHVDILLAVWLSSGLRLI